MTVVQAYMWKLFSMALMVNITKTKMKQLFAVVNKRTELVLGASVSKRLKEDQEL